MSKFEISTKQLVDYQFEHRMAAQHGRGKNKTLDAVVKHHDVIYRVKSKKEVVIETASLAIAVLKFNEL